MEAMAQSIAETAGDRFLGRKHIHREMNAKGCVHVYISLSIYIDKDLHIYVFIFYLDTRCHSCLCLCIHTNMHVCTRC